MKAVVYKRYGPPEVLQIKEVEKPTPNGIEVLIKVHATSVNRTDTATIKATPFFARFMTGLFKPKKQTPGTEFSGYVEEVGKDIKYLKVGDMVFGFDDQGSESHAQYLVISEDKAIKMPKNITYEQAAVSSEGAHYAYNIIKKVNLKRGQKVLVNGATGGIGSAAVQLLKYYGSDVTAVCKGKDFKLVRSLGAKRTIDYTKVDFTKDEEKYYFVFDAVGKSSFFKCKSLLNPGGIYISSDLGYKYQNIFLPFITPLTGYLPSQEGKKTLFVIPKDIKASLVLVKKLIEKGKFKAVIDRKYPLNQIIKAYKYVEKGQKKGNVVIAVKHKTQGG